MRIARSIAVLGLIGGVAACAPAGAPKVTSDPIAYALDSGGIQVTGQPGQGKRVDFGRTDHSAIFAMNRLEGQAPVSQDICGQVSFATWASGVSLYFSRGAFRGWAAAQGRAGLGCQTG